MVSYFHSSFYMLIVINRRRIIQEFTNNSWQHAVALPSESEVVMTCSQPG
jgi:hypothetical protein